MNGMYKSERVQVQVLVVVVVVVKCIKLKSGMKKL